MNQYIPMIVSSVGWLYCVIKAWSAIVYKRDEEEHEKWMIRSYAANFAVPARWTGVVFWNFLGMEMKPAWANVIYVGMLLHIVGGEYVIESLKLKNKKESQKKVKKAMTVEI